MPYSNLIEFIHEYQDAYPQLTEFGQQLGDESSAIKTYDEVYSLAEGILWSDDNYTRFLPTYQNLFKEQEALIQQQKDERFDFILSIPIADRPGHLKSCLEAIYRLCVNFNYGGMDQSNTFKKVKVVVVEDSKRTHNIQADIDLCRDYTGKGLDVHHYGQDEQLSLINRLSKKQQELLASIIGKATKGSFCLKGQAIARNLAYLKILQIKHNRDHTLYYFVDSDQLFQANVATQSKDDNICGINYFYYINRIFANNYINMLTGKLVGDPPVSPSVMMNNYLTDVIGFFESLSEHKAEESCQFHPEDMVKPSAAAYHDMANLFGLSPKQTTYDYRCELQTEHNHIDCLQAFNNKINYFFFGEHPTRKTYFEYDQFDSLSEARTIYPGNYITNYAGLKYIIPFGDLRLRMSGPTAGRLIQQEIKYKFVTANIPMLHIRTLQTDYKDEFRPGVDSNSGEGDDLIDLGDEFERQLFGDLMLFSVDKLCKDSIKPEQYNEQILATTIETVEQQLLELYANKKENVVRFCAKLSAIVDNPQHWWNSEEILSISNIQQFIKNCEYNFSDGSSANQLINSKSHRQKRKDQIISALLDYRTVRDGWDELFKGPSNKS